MTNTPSTATVFHGLPGAHGQAVGDVHHYRLADDAAIVDDRPSLARLDAAFLQAEERLLAAAAGADAVLAPLLQAQALMLGDPELRDGAVARVQAGEEPVAAVRATAAELAALLEGADNAYFRERAIDVRAVGTVLAEALTGAAARYIPAGSIVIAEELAPLDTARLVDAGVAAFVTVHGGPTCHAAIIARAWGIPAVVGAPRDVLALPDGTPAHVDGATGCLTLNPQEREAPAALREPQITLSRRLPLYANAGSLAEARRAAALGADGIGLLRTEFLFQDRPTPPSENEQVAEYTAILRALDGRPVIIRTLDIGADKPVPFLTLEAEPNPQLGLRGVRLCLREDGLFRTQLRALLRAAVTGPLKIMLPMVTTVAEVQAARTRLAEEAAALGLPVPALGVMIEVPMAALAARELAAVCDFFSLGTNDLLQFLLAADRQHAGVGYLHLADHPAVWPLLAQVITAAHAAGIPVGVCGEWGADPDKLARLLDLGIDSASVAAAALPRVRGWLPT